MKNLLNVICAVLALGLVACEEPKPITPDTTIASLGTPADNEIWFTTVDGRELMALNEEAFDAEITNIEYSEYDINVIRFDAPLTIVGTDAFNNCRNINNISLPEGVTTIGERAFFECIQLECMTLGSKIKSCGAKAFDNCLMLYSLHISSIGYWCQIEFANPSANPLYNSGILIVNGNKIASLTIPSWVSSIGDYAFYNYSAMSSVKIPSSIKSIGKDCFAGCEGLSKVDVEDIGAWCQIEFANTYSNPFSIAETLYINGKQASAIELEGVEKITPRAFMGCNNTTSLVTDDALRIIGEEAFRGCMKLSQVEIGKGVTEIQGRAFMGCSSLKKVVIHAIMPPSLGDEYVFDYNAEGRKIYVPAEALANYKNHIDWSEYADQIEALN